MKEEWDGTTWPCWVMLRKAHIPERPISPIFTNPVYPRILSDRVSEMVSHTPNNTPQGKPYSPCAGPSSFAAASSKPIRSLPFFALLWATEIWPLHVVLCVLHCSLAYGWVDQWKHQQEIGRWEDRKVGVFLPQLHPCSRLKFCWVFIPQLLLNILSLVVAPIHWFLFSLFLWFFFLFPSFPAGLGVVGNSHCCLPSVSQHPLVVPQSLQYLCK